MNPTSAIPAIPPHSFTGGAAATTLLLSCDATHLFYVEMPVPAIQRGLLHVRSFSQAWDARRIAEKIGAQCWFSSSECDTAGDHQKNVTFHHSVIAGFWPDASESDAFVVLRMDDNRMLDEKPRGNLAVYAGTPAACAALMEELRVNYRCDEPAATGCARIGLLNFACNKLTIERIPVTSQQTISRDRVDLFYGKGMDVWVDAWLRALSGRRHGLTMLTGAPGTGKTTLLRSLAQWLADTHTFYFMPAARFASVESGEIVTFWADENRNTKLRKVLILEDAESVLLQRATDNRDQVATLLNLTDGMLGDALGLHVICTLNSDLADIDPALLRPGRLVARRDFRLLSATEARRLASVLGLPAPEVAEGGEISLAEIFNPATDTPRAAAITGSQASRRIVGFQSCKPLVTPQ